MKIAYQLIESIGATPLILAPDRHDQCVALISHLPYIVSTALVQTVLDNTDALTLASSGFRDTTRLAASDLTMMTDILTTNRDEVLEAISRYRAALDSLAALVATADPEKIRDTLSSTQAQRREMFTGG
jgi:prephenate dehydrogenase